LLGGKPEPGFFGFVHSFVLALILSWIAALLLLMVDVVVVPGGAFFFLYLLDLALTTWLEWVVLATLVIFAAWAVTVGRFWRQWVPWRTREESETSLDTAYDIYRYMMGPVGTTVVDACRALLMLTATFAGLTAVLTAHGWLETNAEGTSNLVWQALASYTWHFLDAIPALKVPETLNWKLGTNFTDYRSGVLLLTYKLLVIIPVVRAIVELVHDRQDRQPAEAAKALPAETPSSAGSDPPRR
jgi:hypothetical protein